MKREKSFLKQLTFILLSMSVMLFSGCSKSQPTTLNEDLTMQETSQEKPVETTEFSGVKIDLVDYMVYKLNDLSFPFVIAKVRVTSDKPINIPLSHFVTSEDIRLDKISDYVTKLETANYFLGKQNVTFELASNTSPYMANIFIPVKDSNSTQITLKCDINDTKEMTFDLSKASGTADLLRYQADDIITDGKTYQMSVSSAYEITGEYMSQTVNGQESEYLLPSTVAVYCFNIDAVSLWGDTIEITEAEYVPTNSSETFKALDASINSLKHQNIVGKTIQEKDSAALFFVAYSPLDNPITYQGVLKLKVSDSDNWIVVNVDLN